ncbi:tricarballylate utilization 4Fe-4S protein TcuB [Planosporangium sp. 12N6]|uniref:tricarballylate utilization 4Fe-4S protein TcuB n=1 Tax=Planosporangium spinosum TaxID=3402278 RepID=UPI003CEA5A5E
MPLDDLFVEAERQLNVCNSCRYCAGYCPVWPALELRTTLSPGDVTHLANLCHDCRDCFSACMYTAPHEFDLNPPKVFTQVREETYRTYVWPRRVPAWMSGWRGVVGWFLMISVLLVALSYLTSGRVLSAGDNPGSPYEIIPHLLMVAVVAAPSLWTVVVLAWAVLRYWRDTHGRLGDLARPALWLRALVQGVHLRHMRGGGVGCEYPADVASPWRRRFHLAVSYGFGLCLVSTTSAAFMQEFLGLLPPYPYLSVPVVTGTVGGLGMTVGCVGLMLLKRDSDPGLGTPSMRRADYGFLWALLILAVTGLLTLFVRESRLFGPVLVTHLASVIVAFAITPYTKFVHWIYRLLAIYKDNLDTAARDAGAASST